MIRRKMLIWVVVSVVAVATVWMAVTVLAPRAVKGPAKRVDIADQKELLTKAKGGQRFSEYQQLVPKAVEPVSLSAADGDGPASVTGRIVAEDTGAGITGASVRVIMPDLQVSETNPETLIELSVISDAVGHYQIPGIPALHDMFLLASADGYAPSPSETHSLLPGELREGVDITLIPAASQIAGHVLDQNRVPIPGAVVEVIAGYEEVGQAALSDQEGEFFLALPAEGDIVLTATKKGYGKERFTDIHPGAEQLELILMQAGAIEGTVTDENNKPKQGLNVITGLEPSGSGGEALWSVRTRTDDNGEYRVDDLSSNYSYTVRITLVLRGELPSITSQIEEGLAAYVRAQKKQERKMETMVHSMLPDSGLARESGVQVTPGQVTRVDLVVNELETKTALVYGRVSDPTTGGPACPIQLQAFWHESVAGETFLASTTTDVDGSYELFLPTVNQRERIWITAGWDNTTAAASVEADPETPKELNLTIPAPVTAIVQCVDDAGKPLSGLKIGLSGTATDSAGNATVFGLAPYVTYTLSAFKSEAHSSHFVRVGVSPPFTGKPGETVSGLLIRCASSLGALTGQLVIPPEAEEYLTEGRREYLPVHLYYDDDGVSPMEADMDAEYRFTLESVGPGRCTVYAFLATSRNATPLQWWAIIEDVVIVPETVTDLGLIALNVSESP
jgi:hypothetical protein